MTSILTNNAAMAALQTLRSIDDSMERTQARVSSGLRVGTASDNAAYWSIATTMRSDNMALSAVQDALGLGAAKVDTAYSGMDTAVEVVKEIKAKIVAAAEDGVDKAKIQEEISQLQDQLKSIADAASFSGENWLTADISGGPQTVDVVGSFVRDTNGNVSVKKINYVLDSNTVLFDSSVADPKIAFGDGILDAEASYTSTGVEVSYEIAGVENKKIVEAFSTDFLMLGGATFSTNADDQTTAVLGADTYLQINETQWAKLSTTPTAGQAVDVNIAATDYYLDVTTAFVGTTSNAGFSVYNLDITDLATVAATFSGTEAEALAFMTQFIDSRLEAIISANADLGSIGMRLDMQEEFVASLTDSIDSGIGRLVDADMNEESTRLKALQTQQQLAIQSLSIANTASENILTLFR